ncbi:unnamed protein product [Phytophthora fragariaefolia]|uniref:Unnamed protein product n=1 Tax=Phytophthora fragariaefolia TaxID=1490495 RepID=A0A9W6TTK1_9STRA|nr:unnamed protein product [Phytophthora fragariaefolia]
MTTMSPSSIKMVTKSRKSRRALKTTTKHFEGEDKESSGGEMGARQSFGNDGRGKTWLDQSRQDSRDGKDEEPVSPVSPPVERSATSNTALDGESAPTNTEESAQRDGIAATPHLLTTLVATMESPVATNDEYESVETTSGAIGENGEEQTAPGSGPAEYELQPSAPTASTSVTKPTRRTTSTMGNTSTAVIPPTTTMNNWGAVTAAIRELLGRIEGLLSVLGSTAMQGPSSTANWATVAAALQRLMRLLVSAQPTVMGGTPQQTSVPRMDNVGLLEAALHRRMGVIAVPKARVTTTDGRTLDGDVRRAAASRNPASGTAPIAPGALTMTPATDRTDEGTIVDVDGTNDVGVNGTESTGGDEMSSSSVKDLELPTFTPSPKVSVSTWIDRVDLALKDAEESGRGRWSDKSLYFILGNKLMENAAKRWVDMDRRMPGRKRTWANLKTALLRRDCEKLDKSAAEWRVSMRRIMPGETHADFAASLRDVVGRNKVSDRVLLAQFYRCLDKRTKKLVKQHPKPRTQEEAVDKATEIDDSMDNVAQGMINIEQAWATTPSRYVIPMSGTMGDTNTIPRISGTGMPTEIIGGGSDAMMCSEVEQVALFTNPERVYNAYSGTWDPPPGHEWNGKYWYEPRKMARKSSATASGQEELKYPAVKVNPRKETTMSSGEESEPRRKKVKAAVKQAGANEGRSNSRPVDKQQLVASGDGASSGGQASGAPCYLLGKSSHWAQHCPTGPKCYACTQNGHYARNCTSDEAKARNDGYLQTRGTKTVSENNERAVDGRSLMVMTAPEQTTVGDEQMAASRGAVGQIHGRVRMVTASGPPMNDDAMSGDDETKEESSDVDIEENETNERRRETWSWRRLDTVRGDDEKRGETGEGARRRQDGEGEPVADSAAVVDASGSVATPTSATAKANEVAEVTTAKTNNDDEGSETPETAVNAGGENPIHEEGEPLPKCIDLSTSKGSSSDNVQEGSDALLARQRKAERDSNEERRHAEEELHDERRRVPAEAVAALDERRQRRLGDGDDELLVRPSKSARVSSVKHRREVTNTQQVVKDDAVEYLGADDGLPSIVAVGGERRCEAREA